MSLFYPVYQPPLCHPGIVHRLRPFSPCYYLHSTGHPLHLYLNVQPHVLHHASLYLLSHDLLLVSLVPLKLHFQTLAKFLYSTLARIGHDSMPPLLKKWTTWVFSTMSAVNSMTISIPILPVDPLFLLLCLRNHLLENSKSSIYGGKMMVLSATYFALALAQALGLSSMVLWSQLRVMSSIFYMRRMVEVTTVLQENSRISSLLFVVGLLVTLCNIMLKLGDLVFDSWSKQNGTSLSLCGRQCHHLSTIN